MPVLENRLQSPKMVKARFPNGTRWEVAYWPYPNMVLRGPTDTWALEEAYKNAMIEFHNEFGEYPTRERVVIEATSGTHGITVMVFELPGEVTDGQPSV
jgi:hypothetical protein